MAKVNGICAETKCAIEVVPKAEYDNHVKEVNTSMSNLNTNITNVQSQVNKCLQIVSFNSSTGTLVTKSV